MRVKKTWRSALTSEVPDMDPQRVLDSAEDDDGASLAVWRQLEAGVGATERSSLALRIAACRGFARTCRLLLSRGARHKDAMLNAVEGGHVTACLAFLDSGCEPSSFHVQAAAAKGHIRVVELLLARGARCDGHAIYLAASSRRQDLCDVMLRTCTREELESYARNCSRIEEIARARARAHAQLRYEHQHQHQLQHEYLYQHEHEHEHEYLYQHEEMHRWLHVLVNNLFQLGLKPQP
jgi:hypothetical protein